MRQNKQYEIDFFNQLANKKKDASPPYFCSYLERQIRTNGISIRGRMLECGCGTGEVGKDILKRFHHLNVTGVDLADKLISLANDGTQNYAAATGDIEESTLFNRESFDVILCACILHHFPEIDGIFKNFSLWLKKGGALILFEPNGSNKINKISNIIRRIIENVMGQKYVIDNNIATPNETVHTLGEYSENARRSHFDLVYQEGVFFDSKATGIFGIKILLFRLFRALFPNSINSGSALFLIFKNRK